MIIAHDTGQGGGAPIEENDLIKDAALAVGELVVIHCVHRISLMSFSVTSGGLLRTLHRATSISAVILWQGCQEVCIGRVLLPNICYDDLQSKAT